MTSKVPLMIVPGALSKTASHYLYGISKRLLHLIPGLQYDIAIADIDMSADEYIAISVINSFSVSFILSLLIVVLKIGINQDPISSSILFASLVGVAIGVIYSILLLRYPAILAVKKAEQVDKNLLFAIKDLMLQVSAGVSLYDGFASVANQTYGAVSEECAILVRRVKTGMSMDDALEKMSLETQSEYLRRTVLQLSNTLKVGGSIKGALQTVIAELIVAQRTKIQDYAKELNVWTLIYMLFAVAIPSIGSTMLILLSSFAGIGGGPNTFIVFIIITTSIQIALIGFIKTRRPVVNT